MNFRHFNADDGTAIVQLFRSVFACSEGEAEGELIATLAADLLDTSHERDLFNYVADADGRVVGSVFFTRLDFGTDMEAFILAPIAVSSDQQREGIGQALINHGLAELTDRGVNAVLTYGDPAFYRKVGFRQISSTIIKPPYELSQPEGWLGQSLVHNSLESLSGKCTCVAAFNNPVYW
ncbi:MAG: N-acetyltransferase [Planctomycetota bacterium]|nr:N-acetyltransferase [Planctomycetota bacterium]